MTWDETLARVRSAAEFCATAGLARLRIQDAHVGIELRRSAAALRAPGDDAQSASDHALLAGVTQNGARAESDPARSIVRAEFVGIVRFSRPAVATGTRLAEDRDLAYVESLGIRIPVRSGGAGRVANIFVNDGQSVEFGQQLFAIELE